MSKQKIFRSSLICFLLLSSILFCGCRDATDLREGIERGEEDKSFGYAQADGIAAADASCTEVHDVAISSLKTIPNEALPGQIIKIIVTIQNRGTMSEKHLKIELRFSESSPQLFTVAKELASGKCITKEIEWCVPTLPETGIEQVTPIPRLQCIVLPVSGEKQDDLPNNSRSLELRFDRSDGTVQIKHKSEPWSQVHQFMCGEAYQLVTNSSQRSEFYQYIGDKIVDWYCDEGGDGYYNVTYTGSGEYSYPNDVPYSNYEYGNPTSCGTTGNDVIEGSHEEDCYDPVYTQTYYPSDFTIFYEHYWEPDTYASGNFSDGLLAADSAVNKARWYWTNRVVYNYKRWQNGDGTVYRDRAYYYLGRIAHLLADMSVPAHVHNDQHGWILAGDDQYEDYLAFHTFGDWDGDPSTGEIGTGYDNNYIRWGAAQCGSPKNYNITTRPSEWSSHGWSESVWDSKTDLFHLFYSLAEYTDDWCSDDYSGDSETAHGELTWTECANRAASIQPEAIEHLAGLYNYFWDFFHYYYDYSPTSGASYPAENNVFTVGIRCPRGEGPAYSAEFDLWNRSAWVNLPSDDSSDGCDYYGTNGWRLSFNATGYNGTNYRIRARIYDEDGNTSNWIYTDYFNIYPDNVTITSGPSGSPDPCNSGANVNCTVTANCSLGDGLSYSWSSPGGGSFSNPSSRTPTWYAPTNTSGSTQNYTISVTVTCSGGESDSGSYSQQVLSETDTVTITSGPSGSPDPCDSGANVSCTVTANCSLGHSLSYSWSSPGGGSFSNPSSRTPTWYAPTNTSGSTQNYTISVTVTCSGGSTAIDSYSQGVRSEGHNVAITSGPSGTPNPCNSEGSVSCTVSADCSLGHSLSYSWSATGGSFSSTTSRTPTWYAPTNTSGSTQYYTISVTVTCSSGMSDSDSYSQGVRSEGISTSVLINEIDPGNIEDWIEIYNAGSSNVDLTGWTLEEAGTSGSSYTFPNGFVLSGNSYVVIHENTGTDSATDLYTDANIWLLANNGHCALKDALGNGIDFVRWGSSTQMPPAGTSWTGTITSGPVEGETLGRDQWSTDTDSASDWENTCGVDADSPTPGDANITISTDPPPPPYIIEPVSQTGGCSIGGTSDYSRYEDLMGYFAPLVLVMLYVGLVRRRIRRAKI